MYYSATDVSWYVGKRLQNIAVSVSYNVFVYFDLAPTIFYPFSEVPSYIGRTLPGMSVLGLTNLQRVYSRCNNRLLLPLFRQTYNQAEL